MTVIEKFNEINHLVKKIFEFIQSDETVKSDFNEYLSTMSAENIPLNQMEKVFLPYIFERNINGKSILKMFKDSSSQDSGIVDSLLNSMYSVFEIKKILKNGFEIYNVVNEKQYTVLSLTKMTNFRGVYAGQYIVARIFEYEGEHYVIEISNVLSHSQKTEAMRYAVMKLIQDPKLLYKDNQEKEKEIKFAISEMYEKFIKAFGKDIILTTNKYADEIIGAFNEGETVDLTDKYSKFTEYKYFHIKELDNNYSNFLENSIGGFSAHSETYDVAVIFDKESGLYAIPFYETFSKIFENRTAIENAKECIEYFLTNNSIPKSILDRVSSIYKNFMQSINEIMETDYSYDELVKKYKSDYLNDKIYSSATVLYCSNAFSDVFDVLSAPKQESQTRQSQKVGRNEPCPCGSGKKYKNCCMQNV